MTGVILVAIHTDGMGTYQARCMDSTCGWKGVWTRKESNAVSHGKQHNRHETEEIQRNRLTSQPERRILTL